MATVSNDDNDNSRQIEVSPLTNYNVMVLTNDLIKIHR